MWAGIAQESIDSDKFWVERFMPAQLVFRPKLVFPDQLKGDCNRLQRGVLSAEKRSEVIAVQFRILHDRPICSFKPIIPRMIPVEFVNWHKDVFLPVGIFDDVTKLSAPLMFSKKPHVFSSLKRDQVGPEQGTQRSRQVALLSGAGARTMAMACQPTKSDIAR